MKPSHEERITEIEQRMHKLTNTVMSLRILLALPADVREQAIAKAKEAGQL